MAPEVIPPPYVIAEDDQRGLIVVITATTLSFVWTCLLIRIYLRVRTREWRSDDYFLAAATVGSAWVPLRRSLLLTACTVFGHSPVWIDIPRGERGTREDAGKFVSGRSESDRQGTSGSPSSVELLP